MAFLDGLGEIFEGDSADMCAGKFPLTSMGGRAEGLTCADPGARTPIGASGNLHNFLIFSSSSMYSEMIYFVNLVIETLFEFVCYTNTNVSFCLINRCVRLELDEGKTCII